MVCADKVRNTLLSFVAAVDYVGIGQALNDAGEGYKQLAELKYSLEDSVKQNFIEPLVQFQTKDIKEVNVSSKQFSADNCLFSVLSSGSVDRCINPHVLLLAIVSDVIKKQFHPMFTSCFDVCRFSFMAFRLLTQTYTQLLT